MKTASFLYSARFYNALLSSLALLTTVRADQTLATPPTVQTSGAHSVDGDGGIIDGNSGSGYFVKGGSLTISNATLQNFSTAGGDGSGGGAGLGGAIFVNSGATVTLNNVNFVGNTVKGGNANSSSLGGVLNGIFTPSSNGTNGDNGANADSGAAYVNGGNGGTGYNGASGTNGTNGFGGKGGNGGNGSVGAAVTADTIKAGLDVTYDIVTSGEDTIDTTVFTAIAASFTSAAALAETQVAADGFPVISELGVPLAALAASYTEIAAEKGGATLTKDLAKAVFDGAYLAAITVTNLAVGTAGNGGTGGNAGNGGNASFGFGGGAGGNGGNGGDAVSASAAAGGPGGNGGAGGIGGFGGGGGAGGTAGIGGKSAFAEPGTDGGGGAGGVSGFGGGNGGTGGGPGGIGGSGYGGAIFVRDGGILTIKGDAEFTQNATQGGDGYEAGGSGAGVGTDLFIMKGATVNLDAGKGHTIVFNGGIADDSLASIGASDYAAGSGAGLVIKSGTVIFNAANTYSGQTKIEGGTLQAIDGEGVFTNSNINLAGGVFQSNGLFNRFVGTSSTRIQWTNDGGFSAQGGDLTVRLSNGAALTWGTGNFVPTGAKLLFGSDTADSNVIFKNAINLNGGARTILNTATDVLDSEDNPIENQVILSGVISNGSVTFGDSTHTGTIVLNAANTYTGGTTINGGIVRESANGSLADSGVLTIDGSTAVFDLGANHSDTVGTVTLDHGGTIDGSGNSTLTSGGTFEMKDGTVNAILGGSGIALNKTGNGTVTLNAKNTYTGLTTVSAGKLVYGTDDALASGNVTIDGATAILDMDGYSDTVGTVTLSGNGTINGGGNSTLTSTGSFEMKSGTVNVVLGGSGIALNKTTSGTVTLNEKNTYTGLTKITDGTLKFGTSDALASGNVTIDGATAILDMDGYSDTVGTVTLDDGGKIDGGGNSTLTSTGTFEMKSGTVNVVLGGSGIPLNKTTSGTVTLQQKNTYTGLTKITEGKLLYGTNDAIASGNVTIDGATAILDISTYTDTVGTVTLDHGGKIDGSGTLTSTGSFEMKDGTVNAILAGEDIALNKTTSGTVTLNNKNTYTGLTKITEGKLLYGTNDAIASGNVTIDGETAVLDMDGYSDTVGTVTLSGNGTINGGSDSVLTSTGTFEMKSGTVNAVLGGEGIVLNKTTSGTVTLNEQNTYTGLTTVSAGTLLYGTNNAIASGNVTVDGATAVLDMDGYSDTVGTVTLSGNATINGGSDSVLTSTGTFEMKEGTVNVVLGGSGIPLNKTTEGTVTLNEQNTYTGDTTVSAGKLVYGTDNAIASGNIKIDGSTAELALGGHSDTVGTVTLDHGAKISGTGTLTSTGSFELKDGTVDVILAGSGIKLNKTTSGTVTLNNANTYTGATNVNAGKLVLAGPAANLSTSTAVTISSGAELEVNSNNTVASLTSNGGTVSGSHTLTAPTYDLNNGTQINGKLGEAIGGSTVNSNGNVTFTAGVAATTINVQTGLLTIDGADLLAHGATVNLSTAAELKLLHGDQTINTLNGDGTLTLNGNNLNVTDGGTYAGTTTNTGDFIKSGNGTLNLSGNNTNTNTMVDGGTVVIDSTGTLNTGNTTVNDGSTFVDNGVVNSNVTNNGTFMGTGTVNGDYTGNGNTAPGSSPGVLTIAGNYTENGTLAIELADASGPSTDNILGYDQVAVGGNTVLNPLTSVLTIGTPSYTLLEQATPTYMANAIAIAAFQPAKGQTFTIINGAPGTISGHFATFTNNFTSDVILNLSTGQLIGTGLLTATTGGNLLNAFTGASGNLQAMITNLKVGDHQYVGGDLLPLLLGAGLTPAQVAVIANKASPEAYAGFTDYADRVTRSYTDKAVNLTPLVDTGKYSVFAGYSNLDTGSSSSQNQADYDLKSNGAVAGARIVLNKRLTAGLFAGFDSGSVDSTYLRSTVKGNVYGLFGEYVAGQNRRLSITTSLSTATYSSDGTRNTATGTSSFHGADSSANLAAIGLRYRALERRTVVIEPELRLTYVSAKTDGFTETNALKPLQALNVHSQSDTSFTTEAAVNGRYLATSKLSFNARLGVSHNFSDAAREVSANVVSETKSFAVKAPGMGDTEFNLGLGVNYSLTSAWTVGASYQGAVAADAKASNSFYISTAFGF